MGGLDGIVDSILGGMRSIVDTIGDKIMTAISNFLGMVMYYITNAILWLVWVLQELFNVFSGNAMVTYNDRHTYLIDVFFQNQSVKNVYWGIAVIGMVFVFGFTIVAVIRKMFDLEDKRQNQSLGTILSAAFRSIFIMVILSALLSASISLTNLLIARIGYVFDNADSLHRDREITFTDEQFATMARVFKTIGNYSMNPAYNSHYNLNSCYNDIRADLGYLESQGVFDRVYISKENGVEIDTWQSVLQELIYATDTSHELKLDVNYPNVNKALLHVMDVLRTNGNFRPIEHYESGYVMNDGVSIDRILFLGGTMSAARNNKFNQDPYLTDGLRGAFYTGERSIYSMSDVNDAFDIGITGINYLLIWVLSYFTLRNLFQCIFACVMRIFNMVSLYLVAPLTVATMPLDDGEKFKQWTISMVVQGFGVLGNIIPMRLVLLFAPIILRSDLMLFDSITMNFIAKILMIVGAMEAVQGFGSIVTGILANSASMQSLNSGERAKQLGNMAFGATKAAVGKAAGVAGAVGMGAAGFASDVTGLTFVGRGIGAAGAAVGGAVMAARDYVRDKGGMLGGAARLAFLGVAGGFAAGYQGVKGIGKGAGMLRDYIADRNEPKSGFDPVSNQQNLGNSAQSDSSTASGAGGAAPDGGQIPPPPPPPPPMPGSMSGSGVEQSPTSMSGMANQSDGGNQGEGGNSGDAGSPPPEQKTAPPPHKKNDEGEQ